MCLKYIQFGTVCMSIELYMCLFVELCIYLINQPIHPSYYNISILTCLLLFRSIPRSMNLYVWVSVHLLYWPPYNFIYAPLYPYACAYVIKYVDTWTLYLWLMVSSLCIWKYWILFVYLFLKFKHILYVFFFPRLVLDESKCLSYLIIYYLSTYSSIYLPTWGWLHVVSKYVHMYVNM